MARQIKAYGCDYKCGKQAILSEKAMIKHELTCFHNPERKACITCAHLESYVDSNGMEDEPNCLETWRHAECLIDCADISEKLTHNCEYHQPKEITTNE